MASESLLTRSPCFPRLLELRQQAVTLRQQADAERDDARARALEAGDLVEVTSRVGKIEVRLELDEGIMPGVVSLPHGYGHRREGVKLSVASALEGASVNDLTDESVVDDVSGNAVLSGVPVAVRRAGASA